MGAEKLVRYAIYIRGGSGRKTIATSQNVATLSMLKSHHMQLVATPGAMKKRLLIVLTLLLLLMFYDPIYHMCVNK